MLFITEHKGKRIVFTDEGIKIGDHLLHASDIKKLAHMGGDDPAFVFTYKGKRVRLPYKVEELKHIVPFYKKYMETDEPLVQKESVKTEIAVGDSEEKTENDERILQEPEDAGESRAIRIPILAPLIAAGVIVVLIIAGFFVYKIVTTETYEWPKAAVTENIPAISRELTYRSLDENGYLNVDTKCSIEKYREYVKACEGAGYTVGEEKYEVNGDCSYTAANLTGDKILVYYDGQEKTMEVCFYTAQWLSENEGSDEELAE